MAKNRARQGWSSTNPLLWWLKRYIDDGDKYAGDGDGTGRVSTDPGNAATIGSDGGLYVPTFQLPPRGEPVVLETLPPNVSGGLLLNPNPDGSISLWGSVGIPGPRLNGDPAPLTVLPPGQGPYGSLRFSTAAAQFSTASLVPAHIDLNVNSETGGTVFFSGPEIAENDTLTVSLDPITYWPPTTV